QTKLFFVKYENKPIGAALVMIYHNSAHYLHGAMDREFKSLMAPYFMHWEIIRKFKNLMFKYYDFWGIDAKKWPGVTRFKLGWGGDIKEYPGSFDMPVSRLWYLAYSLARKIF
ncbi:MAG: peptidoglycan bridge formation glycyltransferase FemA/FemB family protein, partial [Candidatus Taylorbacteria bacterium]|nr:peptidoglycan bridge formation glycyltransferase FemA/FemB family protein [Candidatus Taylorbacteria bacterium]